MDNLLNLVTNIKSLAKKNEQYFKILINNHEEIL
jgi:hypothetical protein